MNSEPYLETGQSPDARARLRAHLARRRAARDPRQARQEQHELRALMAAMLHEVPAVEYEADAS